jgi:hypothetical protein
MRRKTQGRDKPLRSRFRRDPIARDRRRPTLARQPGDAGASMILLLIFMCIGLIFVTLGLFRLGYANEMRSRAQRAADAAAIAAVTPLRDMAVGLAATGIDPKFGVSLGFITSAAGITGPSTAAAAQYARMNKSELDTSVKPPVRPSGFEGKTMRAHVRTQDCQVTDETGGDGRKRCKDGSGRVGFGRQGNAFATARLRDFTCVTNFTSPTTWTLTCDGVLVYATPSPVIPLTEIRKLFEIDLVDDEDPNKFTNGFAPGLGSIPTGSVGDTVAFPDNFAKDCPDEKITERMCRVRNILMKAIGYPLGVGCFRAGPPDHGIGKACDFMVGSGCNVSADGKARGMRTAAFVTANARELGVQYIIWEQRIWNIDRAAEGWRLMENRGSCTQNHVDHPHVSVQ